jgi:DNA-binding response OmpR family regulator
LVVEDDTKIGRGITQALENNGYAVRWVTTGCDALVAATSDPPVLVLLDLALPDVDGVSVCAELRTLLVEALGRCIVLGQHLRPSSRQPVDTR